MNWGTGLVIGLVAFMAFIVGSVFYMGGKDTYSLEQSYNYDKGLHYNEEYALKENLQRDKAKPEIRIHGDSPYIRFATDDNQGVLHWKRPSDGRMDREEPFATAGSEIGFPLATYAPGHWQIQLVWEGAGIPYQSTHSLFVP